MIRSKPHALKTKPRQKKKTLKMADQMNAKFGPATKKECPHQIFAARTAIVNEITKKIPARKTSSFWRSDLIFEAMESSGKKYVLLRFNPDAFTAKNGDKFRACFAQKACTKANISDKAQWDMRSYHFKSRLDEWMQADPENLDIFNVEYLFYDGFDTSNLDLASGGGSSSALKRKRKRIT